MPYAFSTIDPSTVGQISRWDIPLNQWMGLKFEQGAHDTAFGAISRFTEDQIYDDGPKLQPAFATETFGIPGYLEFKEPISIGRARLLRERKDAELRRMSYLQTATHSPIGLKAALGTLAGMGGAVSNPLDFSLMFIPFVGSSGRAAGVAKMGGGAFRQTMARGLLTTEESLATATRFPQFSAAVINGTFGNAVTEIPVFIQNVRDQAIYGPQDAAFNVLLGGATGGAFHLTAKGIGRLLGLAAGSHSRLDPEAQEAAARQAANDLLAGKTVQSDHVATTDRGTILRDLAFNEAAAREQALAKIGVLPEEAQSRALLETLNRKQTSALDLLDMARARANRGGVEGKIAARLLARFQEGERTPELFGQMADLFEVRYNPLAPTLQERFKEGLLFGPYDELKKGVALAFKRARTELYQLEQVLARSLKDLHTAGEVSALGRQLRSNINALQQRRGQIITEMEAASAMVKSHKGPLTPEELSAHADEQAAKGVSHDDAGAVVRAAELEARADEIREQRIAAYLNAERSGHQASLEGRASAQYMAELKQELDSGKILSNEQIKSLTKDPTDPAAMTLVKEHIGNLEKELKAVETQTVQLPDIEPGLPHLDRIKKASSVFSTINGAKWFKAAADRPGLVIDVNGVPLMFYRSASGTGGAKKAGEWQVFFGAGKDSWLIKGSNSDIATHYGVPEIKTVQDWLNKHFDWDQISDEMFFNETQSPLFKSLGKPATLSEATKLALGKSEFSVKASDGSAHAHIDSVISKLRTGTHKIVTDIISKTIETQEPDASKAYVAALDCLLKGLT